MGGIKCLLVVIFLTLAVGSAGTTIRIPLTYAFEWDKQTKLPI